MRSSGWILLALLGLYLLTGLVQIHRGERGVVRRFGRVLDIPAEPGLLVGLPWGMDRVDRIEVDSVRSVTVGYTDAGPSEDLMPAGQMLTGDHNLVNVQVVVYYKVRPDEVVAYALQADRVRDVLTRATEGVVADWVASRTVDEVLLTGMSALKDDLTQGVAASVTPYSLGVEVLDSQVSQMSPPEEVRDAFDEVARAQTQIDTLRNRAEQEASSRLSQARADRYRIEQDALAKAHGTRVLAQKEASRFLQRFRQYQTAREKNPKYLEQLWQEERSKVFTRLRDSGGIDLLDRHLGADGLDILTAPRLPKR